MLAVDTNVLIRLVMQDDLKQYKKALEVVVGGAWVSHVVLIETFWVLKNLYELKDAQLKKILRIFLMHEHITLEDRAVVELALLDFEENSKVGFVDCLILAIARQHKKSPLLTFDKALSRLRDTKIL
ncbi:MAG: type II toxin-antitoxin system VapC family toxin [Cytophagales bacterium]|nr:type II toxin-antitoxin system VapC family toxin [Cytophagales bacterium]